MSNPLPVIRIELCECPTCLDDPDHACQFDCDASDRCEGCWEAYLEEQDTYFQKGRALGYY